MSTITETTTFAQPVSAEDTRVLHWRLEQFGRLGFNEETAWILADSPAELGRSRALVAAGCPIDLVARIVL